MKKNEKNIVVFNSKRDLLYRVLTVHVHGVS